MGSPLEKNPFEASGEDDSGLVEFLFDDSQLSKGHTGSYVGDPREHRQSHRPHPYHGADTLRPRSEAPKPARITQYFTPTHTVPRT